MATSAHGLEVWAEKKGKKWVSEMAHLEKAHDTKTDDLSLIPGTDVKRVEVENWHPELSFDLY